MADGSYIRLHRKMTEWEWYSDINTKVLFLHLLLKANWKAKEWQGMTVDRGQFISSYSKLSEETALTTGEIRTALNHLKKTGEVTHKQFNKFGLFTVLNYDKYQYNDSQENSQLTVSQQSNDMLLATTNKEKNDINKKKEKNNTLCAEVVAYLNDKTGKNFRASTAETQRHICARIEDGYTLEDFKRVIDVKCKQWLNTEREIYLRPKTLFIPSNFDSYLNDFVNKTYDENSNCFKLAKCFENFIQKLDSKFEYENINLVCTSFEQLTINGRTPKEIYAVMATMFKSNNKYMIKKYSDYQLFCKDFEKIGRDLIIDNKGGA
ncbi:putative phage protein (TIGR02220 family) [Lachnotalea glycerini]|uniref:Putative phage protein (TIGR02220 family) n=1 Tax=Lachnotalea glycerini TaxID=1763509 RepID=A0A318EQP1_9FIRM|nr:conserved phage C-terminal domain-containing protein [Lachnotalea glycerini]PXV88410.1 putative phage protein (TIGR02220 family) [Lachnotalea glycerini]